MEPDYKLTQIRRVKGQTAIVTVLETGTYDRCYAHRYDTMMNLERAANTMGIVCSLIRHRKGCDSKSVFIDCGAQEIEIELIIKIN